MIDQIKNPPKGFEEVIQKHFFLKKDEILEECERWIELAKTREANYQDGLVTSHNGHWSKTFQKSKDSYLNMLKEAVEELRGVLNTLKYPSSSAQESEVSNTQHTVTTKEKKKEETINYQEHIIGHD